MLYDDFFPPLMLDLHLNRCHINSLYIHTHTFLRCGGWLAQTSDESHITFELSAILCRLTKLCSVLKH